MQSTKMGQFCLASWFFLSACFFCCFFAFESPHLNPCRPVISRPSAPPGRAGSLSADALSKGLSDLGLPLSAPHLATLRRGLEKRHGRVSLEEMGAALAAQRSRLEARPPANPMAKTAAVEAPDAAQESPGDEALTDEAGPKGCGEANTCDREDAENKDENTRTRKQEQAFKIWLRKKR